MSGIIGQRGIGQRSGIIGPAASNQPAFLVKATGQGSIATGTTILWGTTIFDQGGDFDLGAETFAAPVTGRYQFNCCMYLAPIYSDNAAGVFLTLKTENRDYNSNVVGTTAFDSTSLHYGLNMSVLADMDASDTAFILITFASGTAPTIDADSFFSGYLAC
jgi:hypothetical protein